MSTLPSSMENTPSFSCRWDSGQGGFIAIPPEIGRREWGRTWREKARKYLEGVVKTFDAYLIGECYRYEISRKGESVDGCGGFIGDLAAVGGKTYRRYLKIAE